MDKVEVLKIMAILRGAYPQFYRNIERCDAEDTVNLWMDLFGSDDFQLVAAAVRSFIDSDEKGFPPVPGQIRAKIRLITGPDEMTEMEAWNLVSAALKNSGYDSVEEFQKLPPIVQRIVHSPAQLREWGMMESETVQSVVASNFQRAYRHIAQRDREISKLPAEVQKVVASIAEKNRMDALPPPEDQEISKEQEEPAVPAPDDLKDQIYGIFHTGRSKEEVLAFLRSGKDDRK